MTKPLGRLDRAQTLVSQTERVLREALARGHFPGNRLPSAVELAEQLGVSRETVRLAEAALERDGLVARFRRKGTLLRPPAMALRPAARPRAIGYLQAEYPTPRGESEAVTGSASARMLQGALEEAARAGFQLAVRRAPHTEMDRALRELNETTPVRGICFASFGEEKLVRRALGLNLPSVLLDHDLPLPRVGSVREDSAQATRLAVEHLASLGHRRIAYAHWRLAELNPWRLRGYREGLREKGLPRRRAWEFSSEITDAGAARLVEELLELRPAPTALICYNNALAQRALEELERRDVAVPGDLSVVGAGGDEVAGLTSLRADWADMGRGAIRLLLREMKGGERRPPEHVLFPYTLKRGRTTAGPKVSTG
jgi:DNA-binding LacI/PurR family transcriptional regulator